MKIDTVRQVCMCTCATKVFLLCIQNWARSKQCAHNIRSDCNCHCVCMYVYMYCRSACCAANQPLQSRKCPFALCCRCRQRMTRVGDLDSELEINAQGLRCRSFSVRCCVYACVCVRVRETRWNETRTERSNARALARTRARANNERA